MENVGETEQDFWDIPENGVGDQQPPQQDQHILQRPPRPTIFIKQGQECYICSICGSIGKVKGNAQKMWSHILKCSQR